jgi:hypothetical protein
MKAIASIPMAILVAVGVYPVLGQDGDIIAPGAKLEKLGDGYKFTEGQPATPTETCTSPTSRTIAS